MTGLETVRQQPHVFSTKEHGNDEVRHRGPGASATPLEHRRSRRCHRPFLHRPQRPRNARITHHPRCRTLLDEESSARSRLTIARPANMEPPSIHTLAPLESGGSHARHGFLFQDHVAARYCLEMILSDAIQAVWCETLDDITVLRQSDGSEVAEFVQVKAEQSDQLWSVSQLCQRKDSLSGTSILEKSLANDRCKEKCIFSIVTSRDIRSELKPLSLSAGEPSRLRTIPILAAKLIDKLPNCHSPNGHNVGWWADRATWRVLHGNEAVKNHNRYLLSKIAESSGIILFSDQIETVYGLLLHRIINASAADKNTCRDAGKLEREHLRLWIEERLKDNYDSGRISGSTQLTDKLEAAGMDGIAISAATELRRLYRARTLEPSYLQLNHLRTWEDKVRATLNRLRASLDSGAISDSGVAFHDRSLQALVQLRTQLSADDPPPDEILQGCMYHITALCQHRFVGPST